MKDYKLYAKVQDRNTKTISTITQISEDFIEVDNIHCYTEPDKEVDILPEVIDKGEVVYTTIGVYPNGEYVVNGVSEEDLKEHIEFNKMMRPGRGLMINGVFIWNGNIDETDIFKYTTKLSEIYMTKISTLYK